MRKNKIWCCFEGSTNSHQLRRFSAYPHFATALFFSISSSPTAKWNDWPNPMLKFHLCGPKWRTYGCIFLFSLPCTYRPCLLSLPSVLCLIFLQWWEMYSSYQIRPSIHSWRCFSYRISTLQREPSCDASRLKHTDPKWRLQANPIQDHKWFATLKFVFFSTKLCTDWNVLWLGLFT